MTVDYNVIYNKLNLREKKKKKTSCASTLKEEPSKTKDDFDWLENLEVEDDEEAPAPQEVTQTPPPQWRSIWNTLDHLSVRVNHMTLGMEEMRRVQEEMRRDQNVLMRNHEVLILDMTTHFGIPLDSYTFHYLLSSRVSPGDPPEGDDVKTRPTLCDSSIACY